MNLDNQSLLEELKLLFEKKSISYREDEQGLFIALPNKFGELLIAQLPDGDDVIGLVGEHWHTHSECLANKQLSRAESILKFVEDINTGNYFLIKEQDPDKKAIRTIIEDLEKYAKYLPKGSSFEIYNK